MTDFGFSQKMKSAVADSNAAIEKAKNAIPSTLYMPGKSYVRVKEWWEINTNKSAPKTSATKVFELNRVDPFINWPGLSPLDFIKKFSYEFVIFDEKTGGLVDRFILPINPQNISISMPVAVNTTVTMKGLLEEHNGAPLRMINISGSTGISVQNPIDNKKTSNDPPALTSIANYLFKDTIKAVNKAKKAAEETINSVKYAFTGEGPTAKYYNNITWNEKDYEKQQEGFNTGYKTLHNLARFFDFYLAKKKTAEGKSFRLVFHMFKDKMYYDVTLNGFNFIKPPGSLEYNYSIALTAWKRRVNPAGSERISKTVSLQNTTKLDAGQRIGEAMNSLKKGRKAVAAGQDVLKSIKSDVQQAFNIVNEGILLANDITGLAVSVADFVGIPGGAENPDSLWATIVSECNLLGKDSETRELWVKQLKSDGGSFAPSSDFPYTVFDGIVGTAEINSNTASSELAPSVDNVPLSYSTLIEVFGNKTPQELGSKVLTNLMDEQIEKVRDLTADDFRKKRDYVATFTSSISSAFSESADSQTGIDSSNLEILYGLNEILIGLDGLISTLDSSNDVRENDYAAFYKDFAINNGLNFENSQSKFYVPFPYGSSMESLAYQYLGDENRWIEIAALNGLKAPYIDEDGFEIKLINSAIGNSVVVSSTKNLYIGQIVQVLSDTKKAVARKVRTIDTYSASESIVIFEAVENETLSGYKLSENARIRTYLPNTINSLKLIAIPSNQEPSISGKVKLGAQIEDLNGIARTAKADFLLNSNGDIVFNSGGDVQVANGLTNLIQAAVIKLRTKPGYLLQHPEFGAGVEPGSPNSEVDAEQILEFIKSSFAEDPRFSGILSSVVEKKQNAISIKILLGVAGSDSLLPFETTIPL